MLESVEGGECGPLPIEPLTAYHLDTSEVAAQFESNGPSVSSLLDWHASIKEGRDTRRHLNGNLSLVPFQRSLSAMSVGLEQGHDAPKHDGFRCLGDCPRINIAFVPGLFCQPFLIQLSAGWRCQIFSRLCVRQRRVHSPLTFLRPRSRNCRKPRACLICPNTGSTMCFLFA
jgi:hypothetical protein